MEKVFITLGPGVHLIIGSRCNKQIFSGQIKNIGRIWFNIHMES